MTNRGVIALVSRDSGVLASLKSSLVGLEQFEIFTFSSIPDFYRQCLGKKVVVALWESKDFLRRNADVDKIYRTLNQILPVVLFRKEEDGTFSGEHGLITFGKVSFFGRLLEFIKLREESARILRKHERSPFLLYAAIRIPSLSNETERSATLNLSMGGAFFVTCDLRYKKGTVIETLLVSPDDTSARIRTNAIVRWDQPWGAKLHHLPGIGVEFSDLSNSSDVWLRHWLKKQNEVPPAFEKTIG